MRYIGQFDRLLWGVSLGFVAGVLFINILPWFRGPSVPGRPGLSPNKADRRSMDAPAESPPVISRKPVSLAGQSRSTESAWEDQARECFKVIAERNMFRRDLATASKKASSSDPDAGGIGSRAQTQAQTNHMLAFRLLGTVASEERDSYAVLETIETKSQDIYRVGQMIGDARIDRIEQNRVVVIRNGSREVLELALTGRSAAPSPPVVAIAPSPVQQAPEDLVRVATNGNRHINAGASSSQTSQMAKSFLSKIRLSPSIVDGESEGLRISGLEDSTMAQMIGLKDGDVIQAINRHPVANRRKAVQVLSKARRSGSAELSLMRDQESKSLVFQSNAW